MHAAAHALINVLPALVACNVEDLQAECGAADGTRYRPERLLLYDAHPGGIGISAQVRLRLCKPRRVCAGPARSF